MSITRGQFLRSLGKSLPGLVASTGVATAAHAIFQRVALAAPLEIPPANTEHEPVPFVHHGPLDGNALALTFDDGPVPGVTERILDTLRSHNVRATFFHIGEKVAAAPDLALRVLAEGHEIGHHTYTHPKLTELSDKQVDAELDQPVSLFANLLKTRARWFRPPFGALRMDQARRVRDRGMRVAMWSLDSEDWRGTDADNIADRIVKNVTPGAITLCHELDTTALALPRVLELLLGDRQLRPVTLSELAPIAEHNA